MAESTLKTINLIIDSDLEQVELMDSCVNKLTQIFLNDAHKAYDVELACVEAINNCIKHAYNNLPNNEVKLTFSAYNDRLEIMVIDKGISLPNLKLDVALEFDPSDLENLPDGGMGLFLIQQIMDKVSYNVKDNTNTLSMIK